MRKPAHSAPPFVMAFILNLPVIAAGAEPPAPVDASSQLFQKVEGFWSQEIASLGGQYRPTHLQSIETPLRKACGTQITVSGPFYCTADETVYLDQAFLKALIKDSKDPQLALGFVVAHEVGHHIQKIIGTTAIMQQSRARSGPELSQRLFTTFELEADCYAGLWVRSAMSQAIVQGPVDSERLLLSVARTSQAWQSHLGTGEQILDPISMGTPEQRLTWFRRGLASGQFNDCDTFAAQAAGRL